MNADVRMEECVCIQALQLKTAGGSTYSRWKRTVYRVMEEIGLNKPKRKPNGITKADKEARKSDDLISVISQLTSLLKSALPI